MEKLQYNRRNNAEISGISNEIPDEDPGNNVIKICKKSNIINPADIESCHHLPVGRNRTSDSKRVIVKFLNRKHSDLMFRSKKSISSKSTVYINHFLCPYHLLHKKWSFFIKYFFSNCDQIHSFLRICSLLLKKSLMENFVFCACSYRYFWGKCNDLQRKGKLNQAFYVMGWL